MADPAQQRSSKGKDGPPNKTRSDPRFSQFQNDPRYRLPSRKDTHVKVDKRFSRMLKDDDFVRKAKVDRYGRRISSSAGKKALEKLYEFDDDDDDDNDGGGENDDDDVDDDDEVQRELKRVEGLLHDPARHGGFDESSSEEDSSSGEESEEDLEEEIDQQLDTEGDNIPTGEVTARIAVVNLDWDNTRAVDLMAVARSFCPPNGRIRDVTVYPSEFGRERMEREELEGPAKELFHSTSRARKTIEDQDDSESEDEEQIKQKLLNQSTNEEANTEVDGRALRNYQLSRLKYFYAVISCDSADTAQALYADMDGSEYLSSANFFDLRFIPDETTFDDPVTDKPRDQCDRVPDGYRPNEFVTEALMHSKVKLTWDQEDSGRKEAQKRAFSQQELDENDLQAYIGSDSNSDDDDEAHDRAEAAPGKMAGEQSTKQSAREKMRTLLGLPADAAPPSKKSSKSSAGPVGDMQVTFTAGLSGDTQRPNSVFANRPSDVVEESTRDRYIRREKERKERRRAKARAARDGVELPAEADASGARDSPTEDAGAAPAGGDDDPFDDPFFADPDAANKRAQRDAKRLQRKEKDAKAAAEAERSAKERAELQALLGDEDGAGGAAHFDMARLRKQEKEAARKGKKKGKRKRSGDDDGGEEQRPDDFDLDVQDPRFGRLFDSHEYAIDPTNPRYSGTKGMKKLLDEGRTRRNTAGDGVEATASRPKSRMAKKSDGGELDGLVQKIKRRKA